MLLRPKADKILILGLNEISLTLARKLSLKNDVVILDNTTNYNYSVLEADVIIENFEGGLISIFLKYQIGETSCFFSCTDNDEYNIFAADLAKKLGAEKSVAIIHDSDYVDCKNEIDLLFNPYQIFIDHISTKLRDTRLLNIQNLISGKVNISYLIVKNEDPFSYLKIKDLNLEDSLVIAIEQGNKLILPEPEFKLFPGDKIYLLYKRGMISKLMKIFKKYKPRKRLFIIGESDLGLTIIDCWQNMFDPIIIVEPDLDKCNQLAASLDNILILHGHGTDLQLLKEEGLDKSAILLAISQNDLQNLLCSFGAKKVHCQSVITLLQDSAHREIAKLLNLEQAFFVPDLVSDYILNFLKTGLKLNKYILGDQIYTTQIKIKNKSVFADKKIVDLKLPAGILIGVIIRKNQVLIPDGETLIREEDKVIIFFYRKLEARIHNIIQ